MHEGVGRVRWAGRDAPVHRSGHTWHHAECGVGVGAGVVRGCHLLVLDLCPACNLRPPPRVVLAFPRLPLHPRLVLLQGSWGAGERQCEKTLIPPLKQKRAAEKGLG